MALNNYLYFQGVSKVAGRLSNMASGVMSQIQVRSFDLTLPCISVSGLDLNYRLIVSYRIDEGG
jgi:hypothetical protein